MNHIYIIIVGCGRLGRILAHKFSQLGHSIVVIDCQASSFKQLSSDFSGFTVEGDATEVSVLQKAKIDKADMFLAATNNDNVNLMVSQIARHVYQVPKVFARVKNPVREVIFHNLNISTVCPTLLAADEFVRLTEEK
jgi:trk system potassium uptake protein